MCENQLSHHERPSLFVYMSKNNNYIIRPNFTAYVEGSNGGMSAQQARLYPLLDISPLSLADSLILSRGSIDFNGTISFTCDYVHGLGNYHFFYQNTIHIHHL